MCLLPGQNHKMHCFFHGPRSPSWPGPPLYRGFTITLLGHATLSRTYLVEWSARRNYLYMTTLTRDRHSCPRRDSNSQFKQASFRRPIPYPCSYWDRHKMYYSMPKLSRPLLKKYVYLRSLSKERFGMRVWFAFKNIAVYIKKSKE